MKNISRMCIITVTFFLGFSGSSAFAEGIEGSEFLIDADSHHSSDHHHKHKSHCHKNRCPTGPTGPTGPAGPQGEQGPTGTISQAFGKLSLNSFIQDYHFTGDSLTTVPPTSSDYIYFVPFPFTTYNTNTANMAGDPNTGTMTVPNTGYYLINSILTFGIDENNTGNAPNIVFTGLIQTNGVSHETTLITDNGGGYAPGGGSDVYFNPVTTVSFSELLYLNAGDQIQFGMAFQDSGSPYISIYIANGSILQVGQ